jgi:DNA primase catalytic core
MDATVLAQTIASQLDIVRVIERDVPLKRTGRNYRGICPFHQEKTPSFFVHPGRKRFFCYGCHEGGDIVRFIQQIRGVSFKESCEMLIADFSLPIQMATFGGKSSNPQDTTALFRVQDFASRFYHAQISKNSDIQAYLKARGVSQDAIEHFQLGASTWETRDSYFNALKKQVASQKNTDSFLDAAERVGLIRKKGSLVDDQFFKRLMFPIRNIRGKVVGLGSRTLSDAKDIPKYLNSPESAIFSKRKILYGFYENFDVIRKQKEMYLVEGYFDVIKLWQHGIQNVCATLGTSLSEDWVGRLKKSLKKLTIIFDGDTAGVRSMMQVADFFFTHQWEPYVLVLPDNLDPDEYLDQKGPEAFQDLVKKEAKRYFDFYFIQRFQEVKSSYFELIKLYEHLAKILCATQPLTVALTRMEGYLSVADLGYEARDRLLAQMKSYSRRNHKETNPRPNKLISHEASWVQARKDVIRLFQIALYEPAFIGKIEQNLRNTLKEKEFCDLLSTLSECAAVLETIPNYKDRVQFLQYSASPGEVIDQFFKAVMTSDSTGLDSTEQRHTLFEKTLQRVIEKDATQARKLQLLAFKQQYRDGNMSWDEVVKELEMLQDQQKKPEVSKT